MSERKLVVVWHGDDLRATYEAPWGAGCVELLAPGTEKVLARATVLSPLRDAVEVQRMRADLRQAAGLWP